MTEPIRLLIVDDHQIVREGLGTLLADEPGITVAGEATSGAEAVAAAERLRPDLVLMDLVLPDMDGIEATRRILALDRPAPVLVLSTFADDHLVRGAIQAGATGYLLKDVNKADLLQAITEAAQGRPALHPAVRGKLMQQAVVPPETSPIDRLTERERDVLRCLARGQSNREIAATLGLTEGTVKGYVSAMLAKLGTADRTRAALLAVRHGMGAEPD